MEREADRLENRSKELGEEVDGVRQDWERKRSDQAVPGANPPTGSDSGDEDQPEGDDEDQTSGQGSDVPSDREAE